MTLQSLLTRAQQATGADRELDALIDISFGPRPHGSIDHWVHSWEPGWRLGDKAGHVYMREHPDADAYAHFESPAYTASVDAALGLVERLYPEHVQPIFQDACDGTYLWFESIPSFQQRLALSIIVVLLTAKIAEAQPHEKED